MSFNIVSLKVMLLLIIAGIAGCAAPIEVRQLSDKTAANVGTISAHLQRLAQNSREIAELRAANVSRLHAANADLRARYEYDVELTRKAGNGDNLTLIAQIEAWKDKVDEIFEKAKDAEMQRKKQILDSQARLDVKSKSLSEIAQALAAMAQEDKPEDRVRFLKGYAQDVKSELDKALESDEKSAKAAKELLNAAKSAIKPNSKNNSPAEVKSDGAR